MLNCVRLLNKVLFGVLRLNLAVIMKSVPLSEDVIWIVWTVGFCVPDTFANIATSAVCIEAIRVFRAVF